MSIFSKWFFGYISESMARQQAIETNNKTCAFRNLNQTERRLKKGLLPHLKLAQRARWRVPECQSGTGRIKREIEFLLACTLICQMLTQNAKNTRTSCSLAHN